MEQTDISELFKVAEIQITYRNRQSIQERPQITSARNAYDVLRYAWDMNRIELVEQFKILLLDRRNKCIGLSDIASGSVDACIADPKIIFATALKARASGIILAHNHPSGNLLPSEADVALTRKLTDGGKLIDINVLDHLIMTANGYHSFVENGYTP